MREKNLFSVDRNASQKKTTFTLLKIINKKGTT